MNTQIKNKLNLKTFVNTDDKKRFVEIDIIDNDGKTFSYILDKHNGRLIDPVTHIVLHEKPDHPEIWADIEKEASNKAFIQVSAEKILNLVPELLVDTTTKVLKGDFNNPTDIISDVLESISGNEAGYHSPTLVSLSSGVFTWMITKNPIISTVNGLASGTSSVVSNVTNSCPVKAVASGVVGAISSGTVTAVTVNPHPNVIGGAALIGGATSAYNTYTKCELGKVLNNESVPISKLPDRYEEVYQQKKEILVDKKIIEPNIKQNEKNKKDYEIITEKNKMVEDKNYFKRLPEFTEKIIMKNQDGLKIETCIKDLLISNICKNDKNLEKVIVNEIKSTCTPTLELWNKITPIDCSGIGLSKTRGDLYRDSKNVYYKDKSGIFKANEYEIIQDFIKQENIKTGGIDIGYNNSPKKEKQEYIRIIGRSKLLWRNSIYYFPHIDHITMCNILHDVTEMEELPPFYYDYNGLNNEISKSLGYPDKYASMINVSPPKYIGTPEYSCARIIDFMLKNIGAIAMKKIFNSINSTNKKIRLKVNIELFKINIKYNKFNNTYSMETPETKINLHSVKGIFDKTSEDEIGKKIPKMDMFENFSERDIKYYNKDKNIVLIEEDINKNYYPKEFVEKIKNTNEWKKSCSLISFTSFCFQLRELGVYLENHESVPDLSLVKNSYPPIPLCDIVDNIIIDEKTDETKDFLGGIQILNKNYEAWRGIRWKNPNPDNKYEIYNFLEYEYNYDTENNYVFTETEIYKNYESYIQYYKNEQKEKEFIDKLKNKNVSNKFIDIINPYKFCNIKIKPDCDIKKIIINRLKLENKLIVKENAEIKKGNIVILESTIEIKIDFINDREFINGILIKNFVIDKNRIINFDTEIIFGFDI